MAKSLQEITDIIVKFSVERGWKNEDPNQLLTAIFIELAELSEHYQWKNKFWELSEEEKTEIGFEYVDVIIYLLRMAHNSGIDIEEAFDTKLPKLAKKFPVGVGRAGWKEQHDAYRKTGKNKAYED